MAEWVDAAGTEQLPEGGRRLVRRAGCEIALFHVAGVLYAIDDSCPHAGSSLAMGQLEGTTVVCRGHGLRFELGSGCMPGGKGLCVRTYPVRVHNGRIEVDLAPPPDPPSFSAAFDGSPRMTASPTRPRMSAMTIANATKARSGGFIRRAR